MIKMSVSSLTLDPTTKMPFLIMKDKENKYSVPIWVGIFEASAIAIEMEGIKPKRPMTHDLMNNILADSKIKVSKVEIHEIKDSTFYASIFLCNSKGTKLTMDARPSDSIALALRQNAPIYVSEDVIKKAKRLDLSDYNEDERTEKDKWSEVLENMEPEAFGKYKM